MSMPLKSLRPTSSSLRRNGLRSLATAARPALLPDLEDEPGLPELQIPSPGVYPRTGSNVLEIKSNLSYHTLAHTLAIVRAVESKCGRVVDISQPRFSDNQRARSTFQVTVLNPVLFDKPLILEIPQPDLTSSPRITHYGPSLQSVISALSSSSSSASVSSFSRKKKNISVEDVVSSTFTASIALGLPLKSRMQPRYPVKNKRSTARHDKNQVGRWRDEDEAIRKVLRSGFKGFYGGFEELSKVVQSTREAEPEVGEEQVDPEEADEQAEESVEADVSERDFLLDKALQGSIRIPVEEEETTASAGSNGSTPLASTSTAPLASTTIPTTTTSTLPSSPAQPARPQPPKESKQVRLARLIRERQNDPSAPPLNLESRTARALIRGREDAYQSFREQKEEKSRAKSLRNKEAAQRRRREEEAKGALDSIKNWFGF